jgi:hypothetical protein
MFKVLSIFSKRNNSQAYVSSVQTSMKSGRDVGITPPVCMAKFTELKHLMKVDTKPFLIMMPTKLVTR